MLENEKELEILNRWIVTVKKDAFEQNSKSENPEGIQNYIYYLEELEDKLRKAIINEDMDALKNLNWPKELMECINNMQCRTDILDSIYQAFRVYQFNKSPRHATELENANLL